LEKGAINDDKLIIFSTWKANMHVDYLCMERRRPNVVPKIGP
jgi:hypothetical protein